MACRETSKFTAEYQAGHQRLVCIFHGHITKDDLADANQAMFDLCENRPVRSVLLDARNSETGYSSQQMIESIEAFLDQIYVNRCAFVTHKCPENPDRIKQIAIMESTSYAYGVKAAGFKSLDDARSWLEAA